MMQKICPRCGRIYSEDKNFCSKHFDLVKLIPIDDLVKICPKCGKTYTEDFNFCGDHDTAVELCYINDLVKQCEGCGAKYPESYNYCVRCEWDEPLIVIGRKDIKIRNIETKPNKHYNFKNHTNQYNGIKELLSPENIELLREFNLTREQFDEIIDNIIRTHENVMDELIDYYYIDFYRIPLLDKMLLFSKAFVKTEYKGGGGDLGHYLFNEIYIDDRLEVSLQITTIIHELSHFLFAEILEQAISAVLDADKTDILEAYVYYVLDSDDFNYLMDEYCAHTVEGRFAILGYQDYGSYKSVLKDFMRSHSIKHIELANVIGNTFAEYIKKILESFISVNIREEIKYEFTKLEGMKKYDDLVYETDEVLVWNEFKRAMGMILTKNIDKALNDSIQILDYSIEFKKNNY